MYVDEGTDLGYFDPGVSLLDTACFSYKCFKTKMFILNWTACFIPNKVQTSGSSGSKRVPTSIQY